MKVRDECPSGPCNHIVIVEIAYIHARPPVTYSRFGLPPTILSERWDSGERLEVTAGPQYPILAEI
jgi:hypothetical protein